MIYIYIYNKNARFCMKKKKKKEQIRRINKFEESLSQKEASLTRFKANPVIISRESHT